MAHTPHNQNKNNLLEFPIKNITKNILYSIGIRRGKDKKQSRDIMKISGTIRGKSVCFEKQMTILSE